MTVEHQDTLGGVMLTSTAFIFSIAAPQAAFCVFTYTGLDMQTLQKTVTFSHIFASTMSYIKSGVCDINKRAEVIDTVLSRVSIGAKVLPHPVEVFLVPCKRCGWGWRVQAMRAGLLTTETSLVSSLGRREFKVQCRLSCSVNWPFVRRQM